MSSDTRARPAPGEHAGGNPRRNWAIGLLALAVLSACGDSEQDSTRVATWGTAPQDYNEVFPGGVIPAPPALSFSNQSIRQVVHVSTGGTQPRVRLSNLFGTAPLAISGVHIARSQGGSRIDPSSDTVLHFNGQASASIAPGAELWSDAASLDVAAGTDLAVTLYVAGETPVATVHAVAQQTAFAVAGDALSSAELSAPETSTRYYWLTSMDVLASGKSGVVVAFGDSITDGVGSTPDANHRYPNLLVERMASRTDLAGWGVVNEGISGNRVLNDVVGPAGASRFQRDALGHSGASHVIILLGINDIGFSGFMPDPAVNAPAITNRLASMLQQAQAAGLKTYLATLLPLKGTMAPYYSEQSEALRAAVNTWIRDEAAVDGVIDFDRVMRDNADPLQMFPGYDSGDHLHPNDAGYQVMADAIDLSLF